MARRAAPVRRIPRDRAAASLYGVLAATAFAGAAALANIVLVIVGGIAILAAIAALRGFPVDRTW